MKRIVSRLFLLCALPSLLCSTGLAQDHQISISSFFHTIPSEEILPEHIASPAAIKAFLASPPVGSKVVASPSVITLSGMNCQVEVVREIIYPTEYDEGENGQLKPSAFETREIGIILNTTPTLSSGDNPSILLACIVEINELAGWLDMRNPQALIPPFTRQAPLPEGARAPMLQPVFASYNFNSAVSLKDGDSISFAGGKRNGTNEQYFVTLKVMLHEVEVPPEVAATEKQLRDILIPQLNFQEAAVADVITFLSAAKGAPNLVLRGKTDAKVSVSLSNVTLRDALRFVSDVAELDLRVNPGTVILRPVPKGGGDPFGGADPFGGGADPFGAPPRKNPVEDPFAAPPRKKPVQDPFAP